jgi:hypothetical protein
MTLVLEGANLEPTLTDNSSIFIKTEISDIAIYFSVFRKTDFSATLFDAIGRWSSASCFDVQISCFILKTIAA